MLISSSSSSTATRTHFHASHAPHYRNNGLGGHPSSHSYTAAGAAVDSNWAGIDREIDRLIKQCSLYMIHHTYHHITIPSIQHSYLCTWLVFNGCFCHPLVMHATPPPSTGAYGESPLPRGASDHQYVVSSSPVPSQQQGNNNIMECSFVGTTDPFNITTK